MLLNKNENRPIYKIYDLNIYISLIVEDAIESFVAIVLRTRRSYVAYRQTTNEFARNATPKITHRRIL